MRYLSKIGSLLDDIDRPEVAEGEPAAAAQGGAEENDEDDLGDLGASFGRGFGFFSSAASAAGSAAAKATSAAVGKNRLSSLAALLGEGEDEEEESFHRAAQEDRWTAAQAPTAEAAGDLAVSRSAAESSPSAAVSAAEPPRAEEAVEPRAHDPPIAVASDVAGHVGNGIASAVPAMSTLAESSDVGTASPEEQVVARISSPASLGESSAPPSSRNLEAEGWSLEGCPSDPRAGAMPALDGTSIGRAGQELRDASENASALQQSGRSEDWERCSRTEAKAVPPLAESEDSSAVGAGRQLEALPRSPVTSSGTSISTGGTVLSDESADVGQSLGPREGAGAEENSPLQEPEASPSPMSNGGLAAHSPTAALFSAATASPPAALTASSSVAEVAAISAVAGSSEDNTCGGEAQLSSKVLELEAKLTAQSRQADEQLTGTAQQFNRLQERMYEIEDDNSKKDEQLKVLNDQLASARRKLQEQIKDAQKAAEELSQALQESKSSERALQTQLEEVRKEMAGVRKSARAEALKEKDATFGEVREEMERELQHHLKQKDDQVKDLKEKLKTSDKTRREQGMELDELREELAQLHEGGASQLTDQRAKLESMIAEHKHRVEQLERGLELEERQKHELALSLRTVEERAYREVAQLEAERSQAEQLLATLQAHLQDEQQQRSELSLSVGEVYYGGGAAGAEGKPEGRRRQGPRLPVRARHVRQGDGHVPLGAQDHVRRAGPTGGRPPEGTGEVARSQGRAVLGGPRVLPAGRHPGHAEGLRRSNGEVPGRGEVPEAEVRREGEALRASSRRAGLLGGRAAKCGGWRSRLAAKRVGERGRRWGGP
mmetsp:Transcript_5263/g.17071  ORF Transcript_5263/g.17071 Transcript_5263/m.17071 type:complete len:836 (+) Transcript_5263:43-2550(+)